MIIAASLQTLHTLWIYRSSNGGWNASTAKWNWVGVLLYFNMVLWYQTFASDARMPIVGCFVILSISLFFNTLYNLSFTNKEAHDGFWQAVEYCRINATAENVDFYWTEWSKLTYKTQLQMTHSLIVDPDDAATSLYHNYIKGA